jgi:hypothetical protein
MQVEAVRKLLFSAEEILPQQLTVHAINEFLFLRIKQNTPPGGGFRK